MGPFTAKADGEGVEVQYCDGSKTGFVALNIFLHTVDRKITTMPSIPGFGAQELQHFPGVEKMMM